MHKMHLKIDSLGISWVFQIQFQFPPSGVLENMFSKHMNPPQQLPGRMATRIEGPGFVKSWRSRWSRFRKHEQTDAPSWK